MNESDYLAREQRNAMLRLSDLQSAPLVERKEAAAEWFETMAHDPERVVERIEWLLHGMYGQGEELLARQALNSKGNRIAQLSQLVAAFEWGCPNREARAAWLKLKDDQKKVLRDRIAEAIADVEATEAEGGR